MLQKYGIKSDEIFNSIGEALIVIENEMKIISVNRSYSEMFNISPIDLLGVVIRDLNGGQWNTPEICALLERSITNKESFSDFLLKKQFTNLGFRVFLFNGHPITSDRGEDYFLIAIEDITKKYKVFSKIIGGAVHDEVHSEGIAFELDISECNQTEKNTKISEEQFRAFVTASSDAIYRMSPDWKVLRSLRGRNFITATESPNPFWIDEYVSKDDQPIVQSAIDEAIRKKSIYELEHRVLRIDGTIGWVFSRAVPVIDEIGEITEWFGSATDITERKELEAQLRKERELLEAIIETIPVMITVYDPQLREISVNRALEQITGWTNEDARNYNLMELIYPDTEYRNKVTEFMVSLTPGFRDFNMNGKHGEEIESSWANVRLPDGRQVGIGIDIRERKRNERDIQISAERFRKITSSNIIGVTIGDIDGNLIYANDYFLNAIGYNGESVVEKNFSMVHHTPAECLHLIEKAKEELRKKGSALPYEQEMNRKDGSRIWVLIASVILPGPGNMVFSFILDISIRKSALEEAQARQAEIEAILNSFPDGYIVYNGDATIRMLNNVSRDIFKYPKEIEKSSSRRRIDYLKPLKSNGQSFPFEEIPYIRALRGEFVKNQDEFYSKE